MAFRVSRFRDASFSDINGTNVWDLDTTVFCDTLSDLPGMNDINNYHLVIGCRAIIIATGAKYFLSSNGTWVEDTKSGGGGGGGGSITVDTQVLPNSTNPVQNKAIYAFVNSSVATNTASFQGTYHSLAELEAVQNPTNNDYGFVIDVQSVILLDTEPADWSTNWSDYYILSDDEYVPVGGSTAPTFEQNTYYKADGVVYKRYKYNASAAQWEFEYDLNNSSFTAAEWATIQSGLTASDKTKYDGYEAIINSKPGLIESSGGEIFNSYSGSSKNSAYDRAHAEGFGTSASGLASHSEGVGTTASGDQSHAEGKNTTASGFASHTEGESTNATNYYAHAEGNNTTASGRCAHAEGVGTKATNAFSHAEGAGTTASGEYSHAEGSGTSASGSSSHAEGSGTTASNSQSHAEGQGTKALGNCSHAEGNYTTAQGQSQHTEGEYNVLDTDVSSNNPRGTFAHIIGNGTSDSNRSNAYAIGWDGKIYQPSDPNADPNGVFLSSKAAKATTLSGYGITDAKFTPSTGTIQLGSNTLVPVTTIQINGTTQTNTNGTVNLPALTAGTAIGIANNTVSVKVGDGLTTDTSGNLKTTIVGEIMSETAYEQLSTKTADVYFTYD